MFNRLNSSVPVLCVSSLLLIAGCGDQTATNTPAPAADDASSTSAGQASSAAQVDNTVVEALNTNATLTEDPASANRRGRDRVEELTATTAPAHNHASHSGPIVVVAEPAVLDLGEMATGETKTGVVTLRNTGDKPMTVLDSRTSCGCTVANVPKGQELQPGESVDVDVSLRGGTRPETLSKTVTFMVDGQAPTTVRVEGRTIAYVVIEPAIIQLDSLPNNELTLRAEDGEAFRITAMHPRIAENLNEEASTEHKLTLSMDRWEENGQPRRLLFYIDHPKVSQVTAAIRVPAGMGTGTARSADASQARTPTRMTPDFLIVQNRTDEFLAQLQEGTVDVNMTDRTGTSLLSLASKSGNTAIMQALIDGDADIEATDRQGRTPLMHAAQSKNAQAVRMLIDAGANIDTRDSTLANTALSWAAGFGDAESVRELLDAGAQTEIVSNHTGFTPLILASGFGEPDSIRHLVQAGAQLEAVDTLQGFTALMYAASTGKADNIRALLEQNADIEAKDPNGRTVLLVAASTAGADAQTIQTLLDAGADVSAVDRAGKNALDHAQARTDPRRDEVVAVLEPVVVASGE